MKHAACLLSLAVWGLTAWPLAAQGSKPRASHEEIEILRQLLQTNLAKGYADAAAQTLSGTHQLHMRMLESNQGNRSAWLYQDVPVLQYLQPGQQPLQSTLQPLDFAGQYTLDWQRTAGQVKGPSTQPAMTVEGVHLPGRGLIFTLTMPPWPEGVFHLRSQLKQAELSAWELARRQLRGDGGVYEIALALQTGPSLKEVLLKVLAENGKYLQSLADDESVTLVVIFRGGPAPAPKPSPAAKPKPAANPNPAKEDAADPLLVESYRRLIDMHTKQGRYEEAVKAIDRLLLQTQESAAVTDKMAHARRQYLKEALQLYLKMESLSPEEAAKMRKISEELTQDSSKGASKPAAAPDATPLHLPTRLIITAPKSVLQRAGTGKLDPAAFEKAVKIEQLTWEK